MSRPYPYLRGVAVTICILVALSGCAVRPSAPASVTDATATPQTATATTVSASVAAPTPTPRATVRPATAASTPDPRIPQKAYDTLQYVRAHNGDPPPGFTGGTIFENRERLLPPGRYREYDVDRNTGRGRNAERLVIEQASGQAYYTGDHYDSFIPIRAER